MQNKRILDLGCGSIKGYDDTYGGLFRNKGNEKYERDFEPWFCRALLELGAIPVGVDIGNIKGEEFEHYQLDLSKPGALDFLPDKSFNGINARLLLSSPNLEKILKASRRNLIEFEKELNDQVKRLLKDDGKVILFTERSIGR